MKRIIFILSCVLAWLPIQAAREFGGSAYLSNTSGLTSVPFTVSCWFKTTSITTPQILFNLANTSNDDSHYLFFRGNVSGDPLTVSSYTASASGEASTGTSSIATNTWYHAAGVWASSTSRSVFLNGAKFTDTATSNPSGFNQTTVGASIDTSTYFYFTGLIGEFGMWNVALDDAEILALAKGLSPLKVRPGNLVEYWPLFGHSTDEAGRKGITLSNSSTTASDDNPRIYR